MTEVKEKKVDIKESEHSEIKEEQIEKKEESKTEPKEKGLVKKLYSPLSTFRSMDRFFNDITQWMEDSFWRPFSLFDYEPFSLRVFDDEPFFRTPLSNITEDETGYNLTAEMPGLDKGDLEITIHDGTLEIKGEKKEEHEEKDEKGTVRRKEYSSSSYHRSFTLPENIEEDKINATLEKGVLKLTLPKAEPEIKEKKKIEVK